MIKQGEGALATFTGACTKCPRKATHVNHGGSGLCCKCYVEEGNPPADFHPLCVETYMKMLQDQPRMTFEQIFEQDK